MVTIVITPSQTLALAGSATRQRMLLVATDNNDPENNMLLVAGWIAVDPGGAFG